MNKTIRSGIIMPLLVVVTVCNYAQVNISEAPISIPTYAMGVPDKNPAFYLPEVYQGAQLRIYPYVNNSSITDQKVERIYKGLFLENEYIKLCILPELGGRLYYAVDKINGYDLVYRNHVIKPALIGMTGGWISGGVEWNIPHHHRASTIMPVAYRLEEHADGSKTIWVGETEKRSQTRWIVGLTLYPGKAYIETTIRCFNTTPVIQSFLAWANTAVHANPDYQVIFPPDAERAAFHSKVEFTNYPIANQFYQGIDFRGNIDLSWWKNTPSPTSFFAWGSAMNFLAGYDHGKNAGILLTGDHSVFPGKKFWNWGNNEVQRLWDKMLTDNDGPYLELMMGMYSDNQPDYSWNNPFGTKEGTMYYAPLRDMPSVKNANKNGAVDMELLPGKISIHANVYAEFRNARIIVTDGESQISDETVSLDPASTYHKEIKLLKNAASPGIRILDSAGEELVGYHPELQKNEPIPSTYNEPENPSEIKSPDDLYLTGLRLEQFHNAVYDPTAYYFEGLKRDSMQIDANTQLGIWYLKQMNYPESEKYLRRVVAKITGNYTKPKMTEPLYYLGLCLFRQGRLSEAGEWLQQSAWNNAWYAPSMLLLGTIDSRKNNLKEAVVKLRNSVDAGVSIDGLNRLAALSRTQGRTEASGSLLKRALELDPLNPVTQYEQWLYESLTKNNSAKLRPEIFGSDADSYLEVAAFYMELGLLREATGVLDLASSLQSHPAANDPLVYYYKAYCQGLSGNTSEAARAIDSAKTCSLDYCFPYGNISLEVLRFATRFDSLDAKAWYLLGNILCDPQPREAVKAWEMAVKLDPALAIAYRNLAFLYANVDHDAEKAIQTIRKAISLKADDPVWIQEAELYHEYAGYSVDKRLDFLDAHASTVSLWDKTILSRVDLLIYKDRLDEAIELLKNNHFYIAELTMLNPHNSWSDAHFYRGMKYLEQKQFDKAIADFEAITVFPRNLEIARDAKTNLANYGLARVYQALGNKKLAKEYFKRLAGPEYMQQGWGEQKTAFISYYQARALEELGEKEKAIVIYKRLISDGRQSMVAKPHEALCLNSIRILIGQKNQIAEAFFSMALGYLGMGNAEDAKIALKNALDSNPYMTNAWFMSE
jgi:tetratricopeptide (TPR) repeat protein